MRVLSVAVALFLAGLMQALAGTADISQECDSAKGLLQILCSGKPVFVYAFASNQVKPYVRELRAPDGVNVLLDGPADHLHHHGLMYAVRVNGINFWEETGEPGIEKHISISPSPVSKNNGVFTSGFTEEIHWLASRGANASQPLLIEQREIQVLIDPARNETALQWRSRFQAGPVAVKLTGTAYNGLGMRFPEQWNGAARHLNSAGLPYTTQHRWDVTPAKWAAVIDSAAGGTSTAILALPGNAGSTRFFSMNDPFTYLSATQNLEQEPLEYAPGARFEVGYVVLVARGAKESAWFEQRFREWKLP